jgi:hypothetical protein
MLKTRLHVRSALPFKQHTGGFVVKWVATSEYPLLYVPDLFGSREASIAVSFAVPNLLVVGVTHELGYVEVFTILLSESPF